MLNEMLVVQAFLDLKYNLSFLQKKRTYKILEFLKNFSRFILDDPMFSFEIKEKAQYVF